MIDTPRHELDDVIDRVAAKMVAIDEADILPSVMARLPERAATPWFMAMPVQLAAAAVVILVAFWYSRPPREASLVAVTVPSVDAKPAAPLGTLARVERSLRPPNPDPRSPIPEDHERSLAPVEAIEALELEGIAPAAMTLDGPASLEPLVVTELVLGKGDQ